jgi:hypothetical protein
MSPKFIKSLVNHNNLLAQEIDVHAKVFAEFNSFLEQCDIELSSNQELVYERVTNAFVEMQPLKRLFIKHQKKAQELNSPAYLTYAQLASFIQHAEINIMEFLVRYFSRLMIRPRNLKKVLAVLPHGNFWRGKIEASIESNDGEKKSNEQTNSSKKRFQFQIENMLRPGEKLTHMYYDNVNCVWSGKGSDFARFIFENSSKFQIPPTPTIILKMAKSHKVDVSLATIKNLSSRLAKGSK